MKRIVIVSAFLPAIGCAFLLGGCAPLPLALIDQHGEIYRGTITPAAGFGGSNWRISMSNGKTTCSNDQTHDDVLRCSDGRTGIVTYTYCGKDNGICGGGKVRFSDGTEGDFTIGGAANQI
ncbi:MAG: hypothetical protein WBF43_03360 [Methylocella sp.]